MNLGTIVQIIIALIFIYLITSLIISELQEEFATLLEFRAKNLRQSIEIFLGENTTKYLYEDSLLSSFNQYTNPKIGKSAGPSFIEPKIVAESLIMIINKELSEENKLLKNDFVGEIKIETPGSNPSGSNPTGIIQKLQTIKNSKTIDQKGASQFCTLATFRGVETLALSLLWVMFLQKKTIDKKTIDRLVEIAHSTKLKYDNPTLENFVEEIANTFAQIMERTVGAYRRNAKGVSLIFGFSVAVLLNIDSFHIIDELYKNTALTQEINVIATRIVEKNTSCLKEAQDDQARQKCTETAMTDAKKLEGLSQPLPIGWNDGGWFNPNQISAQKGWPQAIVGWLMTGVAVAMGAPFWFDLLGKFINVRNTGQPISSDKSK